MKSLFARSILLFLILAVMGCTSTGEPSGNADGSRLYFLSNRPDGDEPPGDQDIWFVDRTTDGWGTPENLGEPVNTDGGEFFPSLTKDGTLYFTRNEKGSRLNQLFRSKFENSAFQEPELLPEQVNCGTNRYNAFVSPDNGNADIYWMDAGFIRILNEKALVD